MNARGPCGAIDIGLVTLNAGYGAGGSIADGGDGNRGEKQEDGEMEKTLFHVSILKLLHITENPDSYKI